MQNQLSIFIIFLLNGFLIGTIFDIFRILRKSFRTPDIITYIEDIAFGIIAGVLVLISIIKFNNGDLRLYLFIGIIFGLIIYLLIFSNIFIETCVKIISITKQIFIKLIIIPIKYLCRFLKKILFKPVIFICVNFKKKLYTIKMPIIHKLRQKSTKKLQEKKD